MAHRIIPRAEWGARFPDGFGNRSIGHLDKWLHHSVTQAPDLVAPFDDDYAAIRALESIGQSRFGGGISYSFPITPAGLIFEGVSIGRIGAHTAGHNSTSVGIVLVGNYENLPVTAEQDDAMAWLLNEGVSRGYWRLNTITGGHRDLKPTACPGKNAYAHIGRFNELADGITVPVDNPIPVPVPTPPPAPKPTTPQIDADGKWGGDTTGRMQDRSGTGRDRVISHQWKDNSNQFIYSAEFDRTLKGSDLGRWIQTVLKSHGLYAGKIDGLIGGNTIHGMQRWYGTYPDSVVSAVSSMVRAAQRELNEKNTFLGR